MFNQPFTRRLVFAVLFSGTAAGLCGCLGPAGLRTTRSEYNAAIRMTNDEELLLNLVRLRYSEGMMFLRVTGVNTQFELDLGAQGRGGIDRGGRTNFGEGTLGFADRPTITFDPRRTPEFTRALITRIDLDTFLPLDAAGWDVGRALRLFVENLNGIDNAGSAGGPIPCAPPDFAAYRHVAELLTQWHDEHALVFAEETIYPDAASAPPVGRVTAADLLAAKKAGYEVRSLGANKGYAILEPRRVRGIRVDPAVLPTPAWAAVAQTLRLNPQLGFYEVELRPGGQLRPDGDGGPRDRLTLTTRSILEVMYLLSHNVAVPDKHVRAGVAAVTWNPDGTAFDWGLVIGDLFHVCVAGHKPKTAAVAVEYRGYWYYIDDADVASKTTLTLLQELIRLQKVGASEGQPVLTLPVGR